MKNSRTEQVFGQTLLIIGAAIALYPLLSILLLALAPKSDNITGFRFPSTITFDNFFEAWVDGSFGPALFSSLVVSSSVVVATVILSALGGYALATMHFRGRSLLKFVLLIGLVMPYEAIIVPLYYQLQDMSLLQTYWALILPQTASSISLGIFWMATAFESIPSSLMDAAMIDGASRRATLWKIYFPISLPAVGTLGILLFLFTWNEFLTPLVFVSQNPDLQTAPLALSFFAGAGRNFEASTTAAAAVIVALPVLVLYVFLQRKFTSGITSGAVK